MATVTHSGQDQSSGGGGGTGDVTSVASVSVDGEFALFSGTSGKALKRATITGLVKAAAGVMVAATAGTDYYAPGGTDVAVADGGTGASTASGARTNLGLVIGTDVLAPNGSAASLTSFPTFNQNTTGSAATLTTPRNIDGQSFNGSANITVIAPGTHAATSKATPVDADEIPIVDSAASNVLKRLTWANLKATAKTYFDTLFQPLDSDLTTIAGLTATTDNFMVGTSSAWASRTPSQARSQMGLGAVALLSTVTETDITLADNTTNNASTTKHGFLSKLPGGSSLYLREDGTWSTPSGAGDVSSNTSTSVDAELVLFNSTSGKSIKRATGSGIAKLTSGVLSVVTAPSGTIVGTTDTQTLTGKTFSTSGSGNVLNNPYKFRAYRNSAANTGNGAFAKITFDTEEYDSNNNFATGTFTAPVNGFYHFDASAMVSAGLTIFILALYKNGTEVRRLIDLRYASAIAGGSGGTDLQLSANDTIDVYVFGNATTALDVSTAGIKPSFSGHLICHT